MRKLVLSFGVALMAAPFVASMLGVPLDVPRWTLWLAIGLGAVLALWAAATTQGKGR